MKKDAIIFICAFGFLAFMVTSLYQSNQKLKQLKSQMYYSDDVINHLTANGIPVTNAKELNLFLKNSPPLTTSQIESLMAVPEDNFRSFILKKLVYASPKLVKEINSGDSKELLIIKIWLKETGLHKEAINEFIKIAKDSNYIPKQLFITPTHN